MFFVEVSCYRLSGATVLINIRYLASCAASPVGGEHYQWTLTMSTGEAYFISDADMEKVRSAMAKVGMD